MLLSELIFKVSFLCKVWIAYWDSNVAIDIKVLYPTDMTRFSKLHINTQSYTNRYKRTFSKTLFKILNNKESLIIRK